MADQIPDGISRDDVTQAIRDFDAGISHPFLESTTYDLVIADKRYPPKAILGLAARRLAGRTLDPQDFKGGEGTRCFNILRKLGFVVEKKTALSESDDFLVLTTEEVHPTKYSEGATRSVTVNVFERDPSAREACIDHYGLTCVVCGFSFADFYGEIGEGFVHVHHLRELAAIGHEYEVDPIKDLRPVCANCHAMIHREMPAISIEELQARIAAARRGEEASR